MVFAIPFIEKNLGLDHFLVNTQRSVWPPSEFFLNRKILDPSNLKNKKQSFVSCHVHLMGWEDPQNQDSGYDSSGYPLFLQPLLTDLTYCSLRIKSYSLLHAHTH